MTGKAVTAVVVLITGVALAAPVPASETAAVGRMPKKSVLPGR